MLINRERTFKRDLQLSGWLRRANGVAHVDLDVVVWVQMSKAYNVMCFIAEECHVSQMKDKKTSITQSLAYAMSETFGTLVKSFMFGTEYDTDGSLLQVHVRRLDDNEKRDTIMDKDTFRCFVEAEGERANAEFKRYRYGHRKVSRN
jgi:hypothetical protein